MHHHATHHATPTARPTLVAVWTGRACRWVVATPVTQAAPTPTPAVAAA